MRPTLVKRLYSEHTPGFSKWQLVYESFHSRYKFKSLSCFVPFTMLWGGHQLWWRREGEVSGGCFCLGRELGRYSPLPLGQHRLFILALAAFISSAVLCDPFDMSQRVCFPFLTFDMADMLDLGNRVKKVQIQLQPLVKSDSPSYLAKWNVELVRTLRVYTIIHNLSVSSQTYISLSLFI